MQSGLFQRAGIRVAVSKREVGLALASTSRHNVGMNNDSRKRSRQIVRFSLGPELAREVKAEAARRGLSLVQLFYEL